MPLDRLKTRRQLRDVEIVDGKVIRKPTTVSDEEISKEELLLIMDNVRGKVQDINKEIADLENQKTEVIERRQHFKAALDALGGEQAVKDEIWGETGPPDPDRTEPVVVGEPTRKRKKRLAKRKKRL